MPTFQRHLFTGLVAGAALAATCAAAQSPAERVDAFDALVRCRAIPEAAPRLACFDQAAARLDQAEKAGDVLVVDRVQVREARKSAFGFEFDGFKLFNRGDRPEAPLKNVDLIAASVSGGDGRWIFVTEDGQVWRQVDQEGLSRRPKKGSVLAVRTAAMGSFFMNVDGQRAIRVRRDR